MNYLQMLDKVTIQESSAQSYCCFKQYIFEATCNKPPIIPSYVILEAIFQTAGYLLVDMHNDKILPMVTAVKQLTLIRPICLNETLNIHVQHEFAHQKQYRFRVSLTVGDELIVQDGIVIMTWQAASASKFL